MRLWPVKSENFTLLVSLMMGRALRPVLLVHRLSTLVPVNLIHVEIWIDTAALLQTLVLIVSLNVLTESFKMDWGL